MHVLDQARDDIRGLLTSGLLLGWRGCAQAHFQKHVIQLGGNLGLHSVQHVAKYAAWRVRAVSLQRAPAMWQHISCPVKSPILPQRPAAPLDHVADHACCSLELTATAVIAGQNKAGLPLGTQGLPEVNAEVVVLERLRKLLGPQKPLVHVGRARAQAPG